MGIIGSRQKMELPLLEELLYSGKYMGEFGKKQKLRSLENSCFTVEYCALGLYLFK